MATSTKGDLAIELRDDHVAVVEIRRAPNNYFDLELVSDLVSVYNELDADKACRVIVLCAEGKHFCAGAELAKRERGVLDTSRNLYSKAAKLIEGAKPVVAAVQGAAIGGGLGLACSADFRIAAPEARFAANFARLGFHQGFGISVTLPNIVGNQKALEMLYTGRRVTGEEAFAMGLCDRLVPVAEVRAAAIAFAGEIALSAPLSVPSIRQTMRADLVARVRAVTVREADEQEKLRATADFAEGIKADAQRRTPNFTGQ